MAIPSEISKDLDLDLRGIAPSNIQSAKDDVGDFVVGEILRFVSRGQSPVVGERFPLLSSQYADDEKGGNRTPNLELEGDMLDSLTYETTREGIKVGIFKSSEVPKADGHNDFSGDSKLPKRRFIPEDNQEFKATIVAGVNQILDGYRINDQGQTPIDLADDFLITPPIAARTDTSISIETVLADILGGFL